MPSELRFLAAPAAEKHEADIFFYSGPIDDGGYGKMAAAVTKSGSTGRKRAILILVTNGGSANAAYQIARLFQKLYDDFWLYCPSQCKSAGTLIAIGAHRLLMDSFSELGPLDVQLLKEDEIGARKSGLLARATFDALSEESFRLYERLMIGIKVKSRSLVSFRLASQLASEMTANLLAPVYAQISPDIVGGEKRDLEIAIHYGMRLGAYSGNINSHTVEHLVKHYPSHDFIIDDDEARSWFEHVEVPSQEIYAIVGGIGDDAYDEAREPVVYALTCDDDDDDDQEDQNDGASEHETGAGGDADGGTSAMDDSGSSDRSSDPISGGEYDAGGGGEKDAANPPV